MGSFPLEVIGNDFNGDGYIDLAVACAHSDILSILFNRGDSTFSHSAYPVGTYPVSLAGGDLDNDGDVDLVVANKEANNILILLNDGYGIFSSDTAYTTGIEPFSIYASDLSGDGFIDLAVANIGVSTAYPGSLQIYLNQGDGTFSLSSS